MERLKKSKRKILRGCIWGGDKTIQNSDYTKDSKKSKILRGIKLVENQIKYHQNSQNNVLPPMRCKTQTQGSTAAHGSEYHRSAMLELTEK